MLCLKVFILLLSQQNGNLVFKGFNIAVIPAECKINVVFKGFYIAVISAEWKRCV